MDKTGLGLLLTRVVFCGLMLTHGWPKLINFKQMMSQFPDPIGLGSPISLALAVFAEFFCALAVLVGFKTKLSAIPPLVTMLVAAFVIHAGDPWSKKELAVLYAAAFGTLSLMGGGRYSLKD